MPSPEKIASNADFESLQLVYEIAFLVPVKGADIRFVAEKKIDVVVINAEVFSAPTVCRE